MGLSGGTFGMGTSVGKCEFLPMTGPHDLSR
jgi:hypothetical protein